MEVLLSIYNFGKLIIQLFHRDDERMNISGFNNHNQFSSSLFYFNFFIFNPSMELFVYKFFVSCNILITERYINSDLNKNKFNKQLSTTCCFSTKLLDSEGRSMLKCQPSKFNDI